MKKKPCEFCEVEQFITVNRKDAQMSIEFYPDNALFDVVATCSTRSVSQPRSRGKKRSNIARNVGVS